MDNSPTRGHTELLSLDIILTFSGIRTFNKFMEALRSVWRHFILLPVSSRPSPVFITTIAFRGKTLRERPENSYFPLRLHRNLNYFQTSPAFSVKGTPCSFCERHLSELLFLHKSPSINSSETATRINVCGLLVPAA